MAKQAVLSVPLALSYDTRGILANTSMTNGRDQRRVNCYYEILRGALNTNPTVILNRRPGVTVDAGTYGANTQVGYIVSYDPADTWGADPWLFVKDGTANKVVNSSTSTTILTDTNFYPRFVDHVRLGDTEYCVVQLQDSNTPAATSNSQKVYYASVIGTWTQISDADFTGIQHRGKMEFMDGYAFIGDARNRIYQSYLNDMATWAAGDYIGRTIVTDPTQGLIKHRNHLCLFGEESVEVFVNSGSGGDGAGTVLERIPFSTQRVGLSSVAGGGSGGMTGKTNYYATIGDLVFFLGRLGGRGSNESSLIYYNGRTFEKASRMVEDKILSSTTTYSVQTVNFGGKIAVGIQLTAPTASTQRWLMFFPDINDWFEWESTIFSPVNNGVYYIGIDNSDKLYTFSAANNWRDEGTDFTMTVQFRLPLDDFRWRTMSMCGVIADTLSTSQNLGVSFSDDDGTTWSTARNIDLSTKKKELTGCGGFRERSVRLTHTGTGEVRMRRFYTAMTE